MKHLLAIIVILYSVTAPAVAGDAALTITPSVILTDADHGILFSMAVGCQTETCPESVELIQWTDETRQKVKAKWLMQDKGLWGDQQALDHITLYFSAAQNSHAQLQVIARPTFLELLKNVFKKLKASL